MLSEERREFARESPVVAIVVGGGPAPGINAVIGAATIRATLEGATVLGVRDGFERLMRGDVSCVKQLTINAVSRIHFRGGSYLGISRANPRVVPGGVDGILASFDRPASRGCSRSEGMDRLHGLGAAARNPRVGRRSRSENDR